jgi:hypothetical protein
MNKIVSFHMLVETNYGDEFIMCIVGHLEVFEILHFYRCDEIFKRFVFEVYMCS